MEATTLRFHARQLGKTIRKLAAPGIHLKAAAIGKTLLLAPVTLPVIAGAKIAAVGTVAGASAAGAAIGAPVGAIVGAKVGAVKGAIKGAAIGKAIIGVHLAAAAKALALTKLIIVKKAALATTVSIFKIVFVSFPP